MKTFLQHNDSGLFYKDDGWVDSLAQARAFTTEAEAEAFLESAQVHPCHAVRRLDPDLVAQFLLRSPGQYQAGE